VAPGEDDGGDAEGGLIEFLTDRDNYPWVPLGLLALVGLILLLILILQDRRMRARALKASKSTGPLPTGIAVKRPSLVVRRPGARSGGLVHELSSEGVTIGRAPDNDLVIESSVEGAKTVSDHHARVYYDMGHWIVKDLDSEHGVYVNGKRTGHNLLQDGWQVKLGDVTMTFYKGSEEGDQ
jgi:pSer/pThr/pTyr-binding forkhead associated (FHA) protein